MSTLLEEDYQDILDWHLIQSKVVQANSRIESAQTLGQDYLLHIDKNLPAAFIPRMPPSAAASENNHCARVTVAPHLIGCLIGYARSQHDFLTGTAKRNKYDPYRGGYVISALPFKHCIRPNEKLVYDAQRSEEIWLVSYNKRTLQYKPKEIGKIFISQITFEAANSAEPSMRAELYLWHEHAQGLYFSPTQFLKPGYYRAELYFKDTASMDHRNEADFKLYPILKEEFETRKQHSAALLSHDAPKYMAW